MVLTPLEAERMLICKLVPVEAVKGKAEGVIEITTFRTLMEDVVAEICSKRVSIMALEMDFRTLMEVAVAGKGI
jgi:hypothetical protein